MENFSKKIEGFDVLTKNEMKDIKGGNIFYTLGIWVAKKVGELFD